MICNFTALNVAQITTSFLVYFYCSFNCFLMCFPCDRCCIGQRSGGRPLSGGHGPGDAFPTRHLWRLHQVRSKACSCLKTIIFFKWIWIIPDPVFFLVPFALFPLSISALQWLCNADKRTHSPPKRLYTFFSTLYSSLVRVYQFHRLIWQKM